MRGPRDAPLFCGPFMLEIDDSDFTPDHMAFLREWADALGISVEALLARIVIATIDGHLYIEKIHDYCP